MTDNEVIECFQLGCKILDMDNADNSDIIKIREKLEKCAKSMLPEIHKYYCPDKDCNNCYYRYKKSIYGNVCKYEGQCLTTAHKTLFKQKRYRQAFKALEERDELLDKIRSEIEALPRELPTDARNMVRKTRVLDIIDKYRKNE